MISDNSLYYELIFVKNSVADISLLAYDAVKKIARLKYGIINPQIEKNKYGKPFLVGGTNLNFSLSHTNGIIAIVFCSGRMVGIDVECAHDIDKRIQKKYYSENEKQAIFLSCNAQKKSCEIWTKKEAHCKCIGEGLTQKTLLWDSEDNGNYEIFSFWIGDYVVSICKSGSL